MTGLQLDNDTPDIKRAKNVREGVGLGLFTDLLSGFLILARGIKGTKAITEIIPESESAAAYKAGKIKRTPETPEDALEEGVKKREEALDQLGIPRAVRSRGSIFRQSCCWFV